MNTKTRPSTAPTIEQMATRIVNDAPMPLTTNAPFQHMDDIYLLTVYHDTDTTPATYDIKPQTAAARTWNQGIWNYLGFVVTLARHPSAHDALWGIQSDGTADYFAQTMHDLCAEIMQRVEGGRVGDPAPLAVDVPAPTPEQLARQSEQDAADYKERARKAILEAERTWAFASHRRTDETARVKALEAVEENLAFVEMLHVAALTAKQHAEIAYQQGVARPQIPYVVTGDELAVSRIVERIRWMVDDLQPKSARIKHAPPTYVTNAMAKAGLDPSNPDHAMTFLTAQWNDEYRRQLGVSWSVADRTAEWLKRQPEVIYHALHQTPTILVYKIPLPSEDVAR